MNDLAMLYISQGQYVKAESLALKALEDRRRVLGNEHRDTLSTLDHLGVLYWSQDQFRKAEPYFLNSLEGRRQVIGEEDPDTLSSMNNLASCYQNQDQSEKAEPLYVKTYEGTGLFAKAEPLYVKTLEDRRSALGDEHPSTLVSLNKLASMYNAQGQYKKADPLLRDGLEKTRRHQDVCALAGALASMGLNLIMQEKYSEAEPLLRECLTIREQKQPDDWRTFNTTAMLGGALLGQQKYPEAEPLLLSGYEGMKQREPKIPAVGKARLSEALERLVQLYDALGKNDEAAKWRQEWEVRIQTEKDNVKPEQQP